MPRYFFHLCDGHETLIDPDGREIPDPSLISHFALQEARAIVSHDALDGRIKLDQHIEVRDSSGLVVHQLQFVDAIKIG